MLWMMLHRFFAILRGYGWIINRRVALCLKQWVRRGLHSANEFCEMDNNLCS